MGLHIAKTFKLNPLKKEIYFVKYSERDAMQVLTGYEVYLKRAERSGKYNGLEITSEGRVDDGSLKAIVKVYRKDWTNPLIHEAYYVEYVQMKKSFDGSKEEPNRFWKTKPITMIKKVAVSQAFRMAFPDEFEGMPYTSDEVVDQDKIVDIKLEEVKHEELKEKETQFDLTVTQSPELKEKLDQIKSLAKLKFKTKKDYIAWLNWNKLDFPEVGYPEADQIISKLKEA